MGIAGVLEVVGQGLRREYALDGRPVSLGRAVDAHVMLDDTLVSREHARIEWIESLPHLTDLGSANGTSVNGVAIAPGVPRPINLDDEIKIADFRLTLREAPAGSPGRESTSSQPLPGDRPAVLIHVDPSEATLTVSTREGAKRISIQKESASIGREADNDICIDEPAVSRHHARLERVAGGCQIVDLDSSNGLTCRDVQIARMLLADGDVLWIGNDVSLTYRITPRPAEVTPVAEQAEAKSAPVSKEPAGAAVAPLYATMIGSETPVTGLQKVDLRQRSALTIGRSPDNDLQLDYPTISRHHARISRGERGEYTIEDLGSSNGTLVNDEVVEPGRPFPLLPGSTIRIGPIKLIFAPESVQLVDESRDLRLDALHLNQYVSKDVNLLQDISLTILPREFVALVGVSGAGKSTLMNALAGFWPASDGAVLVNGTDLYGHFDAFRTNLGYVPQDDIIHRELSAEKALQYVARLRLPADMTATERKDAVVEELETLGLIERRDVRVGSLSGGQRKRVSIGVERLTRPGLFFLDEATSGLDPGTENRLMQLLRQLADDGQTIVLITHATKNVTLCDQVIFLAKGGNLAYYGPPDEALDYFGVSAFDEIYEQLEEQRSPEEWAERYRQSAQYQKYVIKRMRDTYGELPDAPPEPAKPRPEKAKLSPAPAKTKVKQPSALRQLGVLATRYMDIMRADRVNLIMMLLIAPLLGAMDLIAWPRDVYDPVEGDASRALTMLFLTAMVPFLIGALSSVREIVKERAIYRRERTVNLRIVPYLLSKVVVGILFALYTAAALLILKLIAVDFSHLEAVDILVYYLVTMLAVLSGVMWGLLISAIAPREEQAMLLLIIVVVVQMVFSGGILPLDQLGAAGEIIGGITSSKWSFEALVDVTQVRRGDCEGPDFSECELSGVQAYDTDPERQVVITHLEDRYGDVLDGEVGISIAALMAIMLSLFVLLVFIQKRKDVI